MKKILKGILALMKSEGSKYIVVGLCTTLVNLVVFTFLSEILSLDVTISNIASVFISILFAYITNKIYVFNSKSVAFNDVFQEMVKFIGARLFTMIVEVGGVFLLANIIGQLPMIAKLETQVIVIVANYFISKWFVFK